ncbi:MAG: class I SAM-dependent DNA methyltransferase, partial [Armatimonadota bacterium]
MTPSNGTPRQLQLKPYHVQNLFSEHYLTGVLKDTPLWDTTGMEDTRAEIQALWEEQKEYVEGHSEAALEEEFIRPVLEALGHVTYVQPPAGKQTPDYAFFATEQSKSAALEADRGGAEFWGHAIAVGDAKTWDRSLDRKLSATSGWDNQNPSFQIYHYLAGTGCRWGILTNGRLWRIYPGDPKPSMEDYYEVDLLQALQAEDPTDFAYFFLFFRRVAFVSDDEGETFLDYVRDESDRFAAKLREDVREHVYDALRLACEGFLNYEP